MSDSSPARRATAGLGAAVLGGLRYLGGMAELFGRTARAAWEAAFVRRSRFARKSLAEQMIRVGVRSVPIVMLVQGFIGVILALQISPSLETWGQVGAIADVIGVAGFRMLGPIITAIVISGFAGASIAAELGTMVVTEEIEAMESMALNPTRYLLVPRIVATVTMMVLLTVIADLMIALGGWVASLVAIGPDAAVGYWRRMQQQLRYRDFFTGLAQAGVFGVLVSTIACFEGLRVKGGAAGVGRATTMTVVYSIVAIICAACVFTVIFFKLQW